MMRQTWLVALVVVGSVALSGVARAGVLDACGNITLPSTASCKVVPPGVSCTGQCTPINMEVSCARQLYTECAPVCKAEWVQEEVTICSNQCMTECTVNPGSFSCSGSCGAKCEAGCSGQCSGSTMGATQCIASCKANCSGYCDVQCTAVLPGVDCSLKCQEVCRGVSKAKVNWTCQTQCQTKEKITNCHTTLTGGCTAKCATTDGALFCDGQYVNFVNSLQACVDALRNLKFTVDWKVSVDLSGCSVAGESHSTTWLALLGLLIPVVLRRRRR